MYAYITDVISMHQYILSGVANSSILFGVDAIVNDAFLIAAAGRNVSPLDPCVALSARDIKLRVRRLLMTCTWS